MDKKEYMYKVIWWGRIESDVSVGDMDTSSIAEAEAVIEALIKQKRSDGYKVTKADTYTIVMTHPDIPKRFWVKYSRYEAYPSKNTDHEGMFTHTYMDSLYKLLYGSL